MSTYKFLKLQFNQAQKLQFNQAQILQFNQAQKLQFYQAQILQFNQAQILKIKKPKKMLHERLLTKLENGIFKLQQNVLRLHKQHK